jgi:hypothetical protein
MDKRYIIFCDESDEKGKFFSHFYGGALIEASKQTEIQMELQNIKDSLNIFNGEMKWTGITEPYADKYITYINATFDIIKRGDMKIRIMFTQNRNIPTLKEYQIGHDYFLLYYQFIKHAFGFQFSVPEGCTASAAVLLDDVPHHAEKLHQFKTYVSDLSNYPIWTRANFKINYEDITDVDSKKHNILQSLDVILGGMQSRLNEKHTKPHPPAKRRSKRAKAKGRVYDVIKERIMDIYPNFNVGVSTATLNGLHERFTHPYRHFLFVPNNARVDQTKTKKAIRENR